MNSRIIAVVFGVILSAAVCHAQTTRPAAAPAVVVATDAKPAAPADEQNAWPRQVEVFAKALVNGDRNAVDLSLASKAFFRKFESNQFEDASGILNRSGKATIVGQHAYMHPPLVMAADIAADFKNATSIPEKIKARFIMDNENDMKRANATAVQWVVDQAEARQGTPIAILILWTPRTTATPQSNAAPEAAPITTYELLFVLLRGEELTPQQYRINYVVFGNPIPDPEK